MTANCRPRVLRQIPKGEELYRLLWGYTETQLREGDDATLVEYLDHKELPFNILAFWNLHHITDKGLRYRPLQLVQLAAAADKAGKAATSGHLQSSSERPSA